MEGQLILNTEEFKRGVPSVFVENDFYAESLVDDMVLVKADTVRHQRFCFLTADIGPDFVDTTVAGIKGADLKIDWFRFY